MLSRGASKTAILVLLSLIDKAALQSKDVIDVR